MDALELKVPPPLVALVAALGMWVISRLTSDFEVDAALRAAVVVVIALIGGAFDVAGIAAFRRAKTTLNPMKPEAASSLVTGGIYRVTRNPMYVGLLFVLVAWAAFLWAPWAMLGPILFVTYMNRFQIRPEERTLMRTFGDDYARYKIAVRRWL